MLSVSLPIASAVEKFWVTDTKDAPPAFNRSTTFASDRDTQEWGGAFYLRMMPNTYAVVEARQTDYSYNDPGSLLNSEENRILAGVTWEIPS